MLEEGYQPWTQACWLVWCIVVYLSYRQERERGGGGTESGYRERGGKWAERQERDMVERDALETKHDFSRAGSRRGWRTGPRTDV